MERPFAVGEAAEVERARVERLKADDPIAFQDAMNTSTALVDAARGGDIAELQRVVADAEDGELLQVFVLQAFVLALKSASLELVRAFVNGGMPLGKDDLSQSIHLVCEVTTRDNFSDAWRIIQLLSEGNSEGRIDINTPRSMDGWTPLCVACSDACLPLVFKLLELEADPNAITRSNATPLGIARQKQEGDSDEQQEARGIISNMLRSYGAQELWKDALNRSKRPKRAPATQPSETIATHDGTQMIKQAVSSTHTRFAA